MKLTRGITIFISIVATVLILFANFYFWLDRYIYNSENFKAVAVESVLSEESRQALSSEMVERALGDRPLLFETIGSKLESVVSGLLDSDISKNISERLATGIQKRLTSPDEEPVSLDLTAIKEIVKPLADLVAPGSTLSADIDKIPGEIVVLEERAIPSINSWGRVVLVLGPVSLIAGILLFSYIIYANADRSWALKTAGISLVAGSLIFVLAPYLYQSAIFASVSNDNIKIVLENIYQGFFSKLMLQTGVIFVFGLIFILVGYFVRFPKRGESL